MKASPARQQSQDEQSPAEAATKRSGKEQPVALEADAAPQDPAPQKEPRPPFPAQHHDKPGIEAEIEPRPRYHAPLYKGSGKLQGKVGLITGGDSGIGRAVAVLFAREGADVAIVYASAAAVGKDASQAAPEQGDAEETRHAVEAEGRRALLLPGDVRDADFCLQAVATTVRDLGQLDILVNNAAYQQHQPDIAHVSLEQWDQTFKTNIYGYFYMARAAIPHLRAGSVIVNCGSITGLEGSEGLLDYASTKGAIHAFTKSLAKNLIDKGIRVNCVAPGPVWTPLNPSDQSAEKVAKFGADVPMQRPAQPEEIAPAFVFLSSAVDSSYITGEVLTLLGGETTAG